MNVQPSFVTGGVGPAPGTRDNLFLGDSGSDGTLPNCAGETMPFLSTSTLAGVSIAPGPSGNGVRSIVVLFGLRGVSSGMDWRFLTID
jgi:hypothetical protein